MTLLRSSLPTLPCALSALSASISASNSDPKLIERLPVPFTPCRENDPDSFLSRGG
jgi:hypothetical protein